jgi:hypothetical protein
MEKLTITTPSDVLSFIGHTLGFWPQESLVCITMNDNSIGATLRIDLPRQPGQELPYARTVAHYLTSDTTATSILFAVYTSETSHARTGQTAGRHHRRAHRSPRRTGHHHPGRTLRRRRNLLPLRRRPRHQPRPARQLHPDQRNQRRIHLPRQLHRTHRPDHPPKQQPGRKAKAAAVEHHMKPSPPNQPTPHSSKAGNSGQTCSTPKPSQAMRTATPSSQTCSSRQSATGSSQTSPEWTNPCNRSCSPKPTEPPKWSRIEWAQQLLLHAYTRTSPEHAAPVLTAIGYINWWEGRGSKAHQFLQLALDTDPAYRLARLSDQMIGSGLVAGWNMNKNTAYKTLPFDLP